jgi:hypothetical protein
MIQWTIHPAAWIRSTGKRIIHLCVGRLDNYQVKGKEVTLTPGQTFMKAPTIHVVGRNARAASRLSSSCSSLRVRLGEVPVPE